MNTPPPLPAPHLPTPSCLTFSPLTDHDDHHSQMCQPLFLPPTYFYGGLLKHRTKSVTHLLKNKRKPKIFYHCRTPCTAFMVPAENATGSSLLKQQVLPGVCPYSLADNSHPYCESQAQSPHPYKTPERPFSSGNNRFQDSTVTVVTSPPIQTLLGKKMEVWESGKEPGTQ